MTRARDALAAERRRMPWVAVDKPYVFEGPEGTMSLLDLFDGRRQLIIYRAFFDPGAHGQPEGTAGVEHDRARVGCSMFADHVGKLAHLNARATTPVFTSRAPQPDIAQLKERMGWKMPRYTITDSFDADFGVDEWAATNAFIRDGRVRAPAWPADQPKPHRLSPLGTWPPRQESGFDRSVAIAWAHPPPGSATIPVFVADPPSLRHEERNSVTQKRNLQAGGGG
jgi:hypothetical protein